MISLLRRITRRLRFRRRRLDRELVAAATCGKTERVHVLLDRGADPNASHIYPCILASAARSHVGNAATVRLLLDRGACVHGPPEHSEYASPLLVASASSTDEIICLLVEHGADVNAVRPGTPGLTPLQALTDWAQPETLRLMIEHGADVHARSVGHEHTALHMAAFWGRPELVELLMQAGSDAQARNADGQTPLDCAWATINQDFLGARPSESWFAGLHRVTQMLSDWEEGSK